MTEESLNIESSSVGPFEVSDELRPRIDELELWDVVDQIRDEGYAVIRNAAPPELMSDLREVIHSLAKLTRPDPARGAVKLLGRDRTVDLVATLPKVMAVAEYSIGKGFRAGRFHGSIKREGGEGLALHSDQNWIPAPFPEHNLLIMFCFACEPGIAARSMLFYFENCRKMHCQNNRFHKFLLFGYKLMS